MFGHATRMCHMAAYRFVTGIDAMMLVHSARPLEMPLDILVKISDAFEAAWRFPFAER